jgi:ketosteroid isomerase-like protein
MDAHDDLPVATGTASTPDLAAVQRVYDRIAAEGTLAGIEELLTFSHEDIELRSYSAAGPVSFGAGQHELLRGPEAIRDFFRTAVQSGYKTQARARSFEVTADSVVVRGSIRLTRPDGSFAETKISWNYHFRDGLVDEVGWEPRAGE